MAGGQGEHEGPNMAERLARTRADNAARDRHEDGRLPLHGSPEGLRRPPGPDPMAVMPYHSTHPPRHHGEQATYPPTKPRHVLVATTAGVVPGLLVEWRKPDQLQWEARVIYMRPDQGGWRQVDDWVPADALTPVDGSGV